MGEDKKSLEVTQLEFNKRIKQKNQTNNLHDKSYENLWLTLAWPIRAS